MADALAHRREQIDAERVATFVAVEDGALRGAATTGASDSPPVFARGSEASLTELHVRPECRRDGVAGRLVDAVASWAAVFDLDHLVRSVNAASDAARRLYEDRGFEVRRLEMTKARE